ncbi:MAG: restriction endonuclease subunit S, partial [Armatimonadetes bacterium]|nr:restriction endonuclease subunit S [Armatimonadota bacterium]
KDSGVEWLGEVPEGWEVRRLKHLAKGMIAGPFGSSLTKEMYVGSGYRVYGQEQVIPDDFTVGDYYISAEKYQDMAQYGVSVGDVLVSCVGTFGKVAVVPPQAEPGIINPRLMRIRPNRTWVTPGYLGLLLKSSVAYGQMERVSRGGTMDVINIGILSELVVPLPPREEQEEILRYVGRSASSIDALTRKIESSVVLLGDHRTALISSAVSGRIDVREGAHV